VLNFQWLAQISRRWEKGGKEGRRGTNDTRVSSHGSRCRGAPNTVAKAIAPPANGASHTGDTSDKLV